jgi:hypothetical protein
MENQKIGYDRLPPAEKSAYEQFERALTAGAKTIDAGGVDRRVDLMKILQVVLGDHPDIIYFNRTKIALSTSLLGGRQVRLIEVKSGQEMRRMNAELEAAVSKALEEIRRSAGGDSPYDRLISLYQYIQRHVRYDERELAECLSGRSENPLSHNAYGALVNGLAVCDGFSGAFCLLAQRMGFACTVVSGRATFRTTGFSNHAWNVIAAGGKYYHVDATWDTNHYAAMGEYAYQYFCVEDDSIIMDHEWDAQSTPVCRGNEMSYYFRNGCYANNLSQMEEIFLRASVKRQTAIRARLSDAVQIPEPEDRYLGKLLEKSAAAANRYGSFTYTWNRNTRCFLAKYES